MTCEVINQAQDDEITNKGAIVTLLLSYYKRRKSRKEPSNHNLLEIECESCR